MSTVTGMGFRNLIGRAFARQCVTNELRRKFMEFRIPELQGISYIEKIIQSYWYSWPCRGKCRNDAIAINSERLLRQFRVRV